MVNLHVTGEVITEDLLRRIFEDIKDPVELHVSALHSVTLNEAVGRYSIKVCRELIEQRVPCRCSNAQVYPTVAMLAHSWLAPLIHETGELFREYIRAGYVRLNDRTDAFGAEAYSCIFAPGRTALEVAIRQRHVDAAVILIEEGERTDFPPALDHKCEPPAADQFELATQYWDDPTMIARLRAAVMRRQILLADAGPVAPSDPLVSQRPRRLIGI